jgi:hypothetical protein
MGAAVSVSESAAATGTIGGGLVAISFLTQLIVALIMFNYFNVSGEIFIEAAGDDEPVEPEFGVHDTRQGRAERYQLWCAVVRILLLL